MKILILLISFAFSQVYLPIHQDALDSSKTVVAWCTSEEVSDPCPNMWTVDEFGRDVFYGCLVYHFHYEYDCSHRKFFDSYEKAKEFADKANEEGDISDVKIDGTLIPKPKIEYEYIDITSDSISFGTVTTTNMTIIDTLAFYADTIKYEHDINDFRESPIPLGLFLDYAEECYNDSILVKGGLWDLTYTMIENYYNEKRENDIVLLRRKLTFKGFIEWLKEKQ